MDVFPYYIIARALFTILQDMVVASPRASLALLQYIASNRALVNKVHIYCYAAHPWSLLIPGWSPRLYHEYMVRALLGRAEKKGVFVVAVSENLA